MNRKTLNLIVCFIIVGCARTPDTLQKSQDIPFERTSKDQKAGKLPIGRVIAIEPKQAQEINYETKKTENEPLSFSDFLILPFVPIFLFVADAVSLFVPDKNPAAEAEPERLEEKTSHEKDVKYRHIIRLIKTDEVVVRDEFFSFKVGDCVVLRSAPEQLLMALPGQCE